METPFTEEEFRNEKKDTLAEKTFNIAMENFKRKTERLAQIANPVIKQVYENQGHMYENILIPITDGKRMYNISCNLKAAYESESKEVVKAFEKSILLHVIDEAWKENLRELDELKHSVQNASYEQKDPLLIYKLESVTLFDAMVNKINNQDYLYPDARTDPCTGSSGRRTTATPCRSTPGCSRATSGYEQVSRTETRPQ